VYCRRWYGEKRNKRTEIILHVMSWVAVLPNLERLFDRSPCQALNASYIFINEGDRWRCALSCNMVNNREKDSLRALAHGLDRKQATEKLNVALSTNDAHSAKILAK
jgi:hypothetical protein